METKSDNTVRAELLSYYRTLFEAWGSQHWWPARTRFEVIVGAFLTQNTAWTNVERALRQLHAAGLLTINGIRQVPVSQLESVIRPAGYFRQKARRLKIFVDFVDVHYGGSLGRLFAQPTDKLRQELLALNGIGPETADAILLYAGNHSIFVVDAYTRRILLRHNLVTHNATYEEIRQLWEAALVPPADCGVSHQPKPRNQKLETVSFSHRRSPISIAKRSSLAQAYNEMHGLIVAVGKNYCLKSNPRCAECPLEKFLPQG